MKVVWGGISMGSQTMWMTTRIEIRAILNWKHKWCIILFSIPSCVQCGYFIELCTVWTHHWDMCNMAMKALEPIYVTLTQSLVNMCKGTPYEWQLGCHMLSPDVWDVDIHHLVLIIEDDIDIWVWAQCVDIFGWASRC